MRVKENQLKSIATPMVYAIMESLKDPENIRRYEEWKKQKSKCKQKAMAS